MRAGFSRDSSRSPPPVPLHLLFEQSPQHVGPDAFVAIAYALFFVGSALLTMRRPAFGIATLIVAQPFALYRNVWHLTVALPTVTLLGVALGLFAIPGAFAVIRRGAPRQILFAGLLVLAATVLTFASAAHHGPVLREALKTLDYVFLFIVVLAAYRLDPDRRVVAAASIAIVIVVSAVALSQELLGAPSVIQIYGHSAPRIAGPLGGPTQLAGYLDVGIPLLLAILIAAPDEWIFTAVVLAVAADVLTFSVPGILAAGVAATIVCFTQRGRKTRVAIAGIALGLAAAVAVSASFAYSLKSNFLLPVLAMLRGGPSSHTIDLESRLHLWRAAIAVWRQHPIFGIGAGNYELEIPLSRLRGVKTHANSLYLQSLVEGGLPLLAATLWLTWTSIATFWRDRMKSPFVAAAFASSIALALHQTVDFLTFYPKVGGWWWIVLALGAACV